MNAETRTGLSGKQLKNDKLWHGFRFSDDPEHWVFYSALLDLWQDEEEPDGLSKWQAVHSLGNIDEFIERLKRLPRDSSEFPRLPLSGTADRFRAFIVAPFVGPPSAQVVDRWRRNGSIAE